MFYTELTIKPQPFSEEIAEVFAAILAQSDYDSFSTEDDCLKAYCPSDKFDGDALDALIADFPLPDITVSWEANDVKMEDWNAQWEESVQFEPIVIGDKCCIHGPNAVNVPRCEYDIVIAPKMSFGSGHHETTAQLLEEILEVSKSQSLKNSKLRSFEQEGFRVLDMGTGTGILAILCGMLGAEVRAIEIDPWVAENAQDNVLYNNLAGRIKVECGDASLLGDGQRYDLILANINRNVLLNDMYAYVGDLKENGTLLMSGFYDDDLPMIRQCAESLGMAFATSRTRNNWTVATFIKQ